MRVLWLTNTPSRYSPDNVKNNGYNGGGWISSAEKSLCEVPNMVLGISFKMNGQAFKRIQDNVSYYPIPCSTGKRIYRAFLNLVGLIKPLEEIEEQNWNYYLSYFRKVIEDFQPDLIHVWGTEYEFGLIYKVTNIPVLLHLQGIINPCFNALFPPSYSWSDYIYQSLNPIRIVSRFYEKQKWMRQAYREREIFKGVKFYLGRTDWDYRVSSIMAPSSSYYHVDEFLRDEFYIHSYRQLPKRLIIVTTISRPLYKGFDLVLKTAKILKQNLHLDFEWKCYGNISPQFIERVTKIRHQDVNVHLMGIASSKQLRDAELNATLYFHPSYIDNSPNSLCEAQMLGLPVVATCVGGISSLISDGETGFLVPANDPYQAAFVIARLYKEPDLNYTIGKAAKEIAMARHDKTKVLNQIIKAYSMACK